jgi:hypothetical protein
MNLDGVNPTTAPPIIPPAPRKEMSARIAIAALFLVLGGCMFLVVWTVFTRL